MAQCSTEQWLPLTVAMQTPTTPPSTATTSSSSESDGSSSSSSCAAEYLQDFQQAVLSMCYKTILDKLQLLQRWQRFNMPQQLLTQRRSSTQRNNAPVPRVLLSGKTLPRLESLLGEEQAAPQSDESVLNALKLERDMDALCRIFETAAAQQYVGDIAQLEQAIAALGGNKSEQPQLAMQLQQAKQQQLALKAELKQLEQQGQAELQAIDEQLAETQYKLKCVTRVNDLEYSLVRRWEAARVDQVAIWCENAERAYLRDILDYKQRLAREECVSKQLQAFRSRERNELEQRIEQWQTKYATELRRVQRETEAWELRILEVEKSLQRHSEVYEERLEFVRDCRAKQEEEQRQQQLQVHRMESAIKLQAWWRGTMVRRGLGPFKKKPKRGKRGKAKK